MQEAIALWKKHWFITCSGLIVVVATILRFYNYADRWGLGGDQGHFTLLARHAITTLQLPFLGPFSSAGPFQTGGEWYWFVMIGTVFAQRFVISPWIFLTLTYIGFVVGMIFLGKELLGKKFGLLLGLFSALSTAEILQSTSLSNQSPINLCTLGAVFFMALFVRTKKNRFIFLEALMIGLASSIHLQGIALVPMLVLTILFTSVKNWKGIMLCALGILIPWLPVFWIDLHHNFFNTHNMIYYYFFEKNKPSLDVLGRNWKTFSRDFMPMAWGSIIGGDNRVALVEIALFVVFAAFAMYKKLLTKPLLIIFLTIPFLFVVLRYTATPLFDSFYVFLHVFLLIATAWTLFMIFKTNKIAGILAILLISIFTLKTSVTAIQNYGSNIPPMRAKAQENVLKKLYPGKKFAIYDYQFKTSAYSQALSLYLTADNTIDDNGMKIGYVENSFYGRVQQYPIIKNDDKQYVMVDLTSASAKQLKAEDWVVVTPKGIYDAQENWYKK